MIVYEILLALSLLVNSVLANYDNNTWLDYETSLSDVDKSENVEKSFRSAFHISDSDTNLYNINSDYNNLFLNKSIVDNNIVEGSKTEIENFPYQVSIQEKGFGHFCGGSLVTLRWVLTATHCFYGFNTAIDKMFVRAGSSFHNRGGVIAFPSKIYLAKRFSYSTNDWDISLVKLRNGFSKKIISKFPIRSILLEKSLPPSKTKLITTGWGSTRNGGTVVDQLRKTKVSLMSYKRCNTKTQNAGMLTERMFCAGYEQGGKDSCQGDSGGPIVTTKRKLVGIVSWGLGCAFPESPGVYTRVPKLLPYIKQLIKRG